MGTYVDKYASLTGQARLEVTGGSQTLNVGAVLDLSEPVFAANTIRIILEPAAACRLIGELTQIAVNRGWMSEPATGLADKLKVIHDQATQGLDVAGRNEQDVLADVLASISLLMAVPS